MRRNMDLAAEILSEIKNSDPFSSGTDDLRPGRLPGHWDMKQVSYHLVLLLEEGFLARHRLHAGEVEPECTADDDAGLRLTWRGHEFLEELKSQSSYRSNF